MIRSLLHTVLQGAIRVVVLPPREQVNDLRMADDRVIHNRIRNLRRWVFDPTSDHRQSLVGQINLEDYLREIERRQYRILREAFDAIRPIGG